MDSDRRIQIFIPQYIVKRKKLKRTSIDQIRKLIKSNKGEAVQALYMVFEHESFTLETHSCAFLSGSFVSFLNLEGYSFIGYGNTKLASRSSACKVALQFLIYDFRHSVEMHCLTPMINTPIIFDQHSSNELSDCIASLIIDKYQWLRGDLKENLPWFKMISGIVMIRGDDYKNGEVVVLCTGSKCIEQKHIRLDGTVIIDFHAEVLVRRAFQHFLWSEIRLADTANSIFQVTNTSKYSLKSGISFYLFVNSAPCGDSRIFAISGKDNSSDKHPNRISRGVLRIKLDGGNSTVPIKNFEKYESDDRLMIMSCSDKLLKANVLGFQGALLSNIIEPIFIEGIVIGDLFHKSHVIRALYGRIEGIDFIPPFRLNRLKVFGLTKESEIITKSPKTCINWIYREGTEILNSTTGKTFLGSTSRLSKNSLFCTFLQFGIYAEAEKQCSYDYFKKKAVDYQTMKKFFYETLESKKLGKWVKRKLSLDDFKLS